MNAIEGIIDLYEEDRVSEFWCDVEDYLRGGVVYSGHGMFMMYKMVNSLAGDPINQWNPKEPDAWFVKWAAGRGCISYMVSMLVPKLPKLIFFRHKNGEDSEMKTYDMEKFCRKVGA